MVDETRWRWSVMNGVGVRRKSTDEGEKGGRGDAPGGERSKGMATERSEAGDDWHGQTGAAWLLGRHCRGEVARVGGSRHLAATLRAAGHDSSAELACKGELCRQ